MFHPSAADIEKAKRAQVGGGESAIVDDGEKEGGKEGIGAKGLAEKGKEWLLGKK